MKEKKVRRSNMSLSKKLSLTEKPDLIKTRKLESLECRKLSSSKQKSNEDKIYRLKQ